MNKVFVVVIGLVNIVVFVVTTFIVSKIQDGLNEINGSMRNNSRQIERILGRFQIANQEQNFAAIHLSIMSAAPYDSNIRKLFGAAYSKVILSYLEIISNENKSASPELMSLAQDSRKVLLSLQKDPRSSANDADQLLKKLSEAADKKIENVKSNRDSLAEMKNAQETKKTYANYTLTALQFFSILLILAKELWSSAR